MAAWCLGLPRQLLLGVVSPRKWVDVLVALCRVVCGCCVTVVWLLRGCGFQDLIGWFKFRRNSTLRPSYRETLVHEQLLGRRESFR